MHNQSDPLAAEQQFFSSLIGGDVGALDRILGDDFLLIDVMTGSEVKKPDLLAVLGSGQLKFEAIQPVESQVRLYGITAVITGRTQMSGRFGEAVFTPECLGVVLAASCATASEHIRVIEANRRFSWALLVGGMIIRRASTRVNGLREGRRSSGKGLRETCDARNPSGLSRGRAVV